MEVPRNPVKYNAENTTSAHKCSKMVSDGIGPKEQIGFNEPIYILDKPEKLCQLFPFFPDLP